ncbi:MAG: TRAP transporter substrate-binding protein [Oscillospiraceae bacterium]
MYQFKKIAALLLVAVMMLSLCACGGGDATAATSSPSGNSSAPASSAPTDGDTYDIADATYVLKAGHVLSDSHPYHKALEYMDQYLCEATNGDLRIEIYPNAQLGNERDLQEGCSMGTVDIGIGATATLSNFTSDFALFDLPYLFANKEQARTVLHSDWASQKLDELESLDMIGLTFWEAGMFDIIQNKHPVKEISDFSGLTIRVMENDIFMATMTALGINPVPMAWSEVFTSIQNGTVDGTSNPPATIYTANIYTIAKNFTIANMIYSPIPVVMSKATYDSLPEEYQKLMYEAAESAADVEYELIDEMEAEALEAFAEEGCEVVYFTEDQISECQKLMKEEVWPQFVGKKVAQSDIDAIADIINNM